MKKSNNDSEEKKVLTSEEISENERIDSVYTEQSVPKKILYTSLNYLAAFALGAVILTALYYEDMLISNLRSAILPFLGMIDDSSGFLSDMIAAVLNILVFTLAAVLFGFALDINYSAHGRPIEAWGKYVRFILPAAFGSCVLYVVIHHFVSGSSFAVSGTVFSQILYYINMIAVVPAANVLLYLVLPNAMIRMLLVIVSDSRERAELPLAVSGTLIMAIAMLGITPNHIENYGAAVFAFALIQSAACSFLYQRTNVIRYTVLMYSGVSALYLGLTALMNYCF